MPIGETEATITIPTIEDGVSGEGTEKFSVSVANILVGQPAPPDEYQKLFGSGLHPGRPQGEHQGAVG